MTKNPPQSQNRLAQAFEASPDPMVITMHRDGRITDVNAAFCQWLGRDQDHLIGKTVLDLGVWDDPRDRLPLIERLQRDGEFRNLEVCLRPLDGEVRFCQWSARLFLQDDELCLISILRDLTEQKQVEEERARALSHLQNLETMDQLLLQETEPQQVAASVLRFLKDQFQCDRAFLVYPCDPEAATWNIPLACVNPQYPTISKQTEPMPMDREIAALFSAHLQAAAPLAMGSANAPMPAYFPARFHIYSQLSLAIRPAIGKPWLLGLHQCSGPRTWSPAEQALFQDLANRITDALNTVLLLRDLRESEARFRVLFDNAPEAIMVLDVGAGYFIDANSNALGLLKCSREELLRTELHDLHPPLQPTGGNSAALARQYIDATLRGETPVFTWLFTDREQGEIPCEVRLVRLPGSERALIRGSITDIRARLQLEEQLRQAQKMEAVGQLAGGIAHDFNNLLQGILGYADLLLGDVALEGKPRDRITQIRNASLRAATLTGQLLAFSRRQVLNPLDLNLNQVIGNSLDLLKRVLGEHIHLDFMPGHNLGTIHADQVQLEQILLNLLVNARDAMPRGGEIVIETENVAINGSYVEVHPWASPGRYLLLSITDNGAGMDADVLERIFEPFFTTKEPGQGTGLGLSMVYGMVKQHRGMIQAYSEPGMGSTFKIYLPLVERPAAMVGTKINGRAAGGDETILVAEDDQGLLELAEIILGEAGYRVYLAENGERALALFRQHSNEIDLVILDVIMPRMGGNEVYQQMKLVNPKVPALFTSGYSANAVHVGFVLEQGTELIQKPYQPAELLHRIRKILDT